jgi:hypothetical protein
MSLLKSVALSSIIATSFAFSCAGSGEQMYVKDEYYNFMSPSMVGLNNDNPFYNVANHYPHNDRWEYFDKQKEQLNIEAWHTYFSNKLSKNDVKELFYSEEPIKKIYPKFATKINNPEFKDYVDFLNLQMGLVGVYQYEQTAPKTYKPVVDKGIKLFNSCEDKFLKERYLFLIMRLYHYHGDYKLELAFYEQNKQVLTSNILVKEWIDALRAGAMQHLGQTLESNKLYADIFQNHKTNAHLGYYDFKVKNDLEWNQLLTSALSPEQKARYYFLRALKWENAPLKEFESIASIAPKSIWFERLSYMIMQDLQHLRYQLMSQSNDTNRDEKEYKINLKSYQEQEAYFQKILAQQSNPSFFSVYSQLYLDAINYKALNPQKFEQMKSLANTNEKKYVELIVYLQKLNANKSVDIASQETIYSSLKPLLNAFDTKAQTSLLRYTALQMASLYPQNTPERALAKDYAQDYPNIISDIFKYADPYKLQNYFDSTNKTYLEQKILSTYLKNYNQSQLLGTLYMQNNDFNFAINELSRVKSSADFTSNYNPFNATISGNNRTGKSKHFTQLEFSKVMLELDTKTKNKTATPTDYYLYANGLYNKSWFGNFPMSSVSYRSVYFDAQKDKKVLDLSEAKKYYTMALNSSSDRELKATIEYQLLKIKYNEFASYSHTTSYDDGYSYSSSYWDDGFVQSLKSIAQKYPAFKEDINRYETQYKDTNYGKKAIKECATFRYF